jgi:hypothetical protein
MGEVVWWFSERKDEPPPWWIAEPAPRPHEGIKSVLRGRHLLVLIENRRYRVRVQPDAASAQCLPAQLWLWRSDEHWHIDYFDLCDARAARAFIEEASRVCHYPAAAIEYDLAWLTRELTRQRDAFLEARR